MLREWQKGPEAVVVDSPLGQVRIVAVRLNDVIVRGANHEETVTVRGSVVRVSLYLQRRPTGWKMLAERSGMHKGAMWNERATPRQQDIIEQEMVKLIDQWATDNAVTLYEAEAAYLNNTARSVEERRERAIKELAEAQATYEEADSMANLAAGALHEVRTGNALAMEGRRVRILNSYHEKAARGLEGRVARARAGYVLVGVGDDFKGYWVPLRDIEELDNDKEETNVNEN